MNAKCASFIPATIINWFTVKTLFIPAALHTIISSWHSNKFSVMTPKCHIICTVIIWFFTLFFLNSTITEGILSSWLIWTSIISNFVCSWHSVFIMNAKCASFIPATIINWFTVKTLFIPAALHTIISSWHSNKFSVMTPKCHIICAVIITVIPTSVFANSSIFWVVSVFCWWRTEIEVCLISSIVGM